MDRIYWEKKTTVESCLDISVVSLKEQGYIHGYKSGSITWRDNWGTESTINLSVSLGQEGFLHLSYTHTRDGKEEAFDYKVNIISTACHYGSVRYWFQCPLQEAGESCQRRVATLYLPPGGKYFGCRHCYNLTYETRSMGKGRLRNFRDTYTHVAQLEILKDHMKKEMYAGKMTRKCRRYQKLLQKCRRATNALAISNGLFQP